MSRLLTDISISKQYRWKHYLFKLHINWLKSVNVVEWFLSRTFIYASRIGFNMIGYQMDVWQMSKLIWLVNHPAIYDLTGGNSIEDCGVITHRWTIKTIKELCIEHLPNVYMSLECSKAGYMPWMQARNERIFWNRLNIT